MINIKEVTILNFRSYRNTGNKIENVKRINVFTGENNSGKTNLLRAINLFFNPDFYDKKNDMNRVKKITGGQNKHPKITIKFEDDSVPTGSYTISLKFNTDGTYMYESKDTPSKIKSIEKFIKDKFRCIYLGVADETISKQAYQLINNMLFEFYKKKSNNVRKTVEEFEEKHGKLMKVFEDNLAAIQSDLAKEFEIFTKHGMPIAPKLRVSKESKLFEFLEDKIELEIDDNYSQKIMFKGAGIQRATVIMLSYFLLNEINVNKTNIMLLDEPEAFLYPSLITKLKRKIEAFEGIQSFFTTHAREFISSEARASKGVYALYNISQVTESKEYKRSSNEFDIIKDSIIEAYTSKIYGRVLKKYGLLDNVDDFENIIICEGETDYNYIKSILEDQQIRPQIRYSKYSININEISTYSKGTFEYKFFPSGVGAIIPILIFLDTVSEVSRNIMIVLDGDDAGKETEKKINSSISQFKKFKIEILILPTGKEIEDMVFKKEELIELILEKSTGIKEYESGFREAMDRMNEKNSYMQVVKNFISTYNITESEYRLKRELSISEAVKNSEINAEWFKDKYISFFKDISK